MTRHAKKRSPEKSARKQAEASSPARLPEACSARSRLNSEGVAVFFVTGRRKPLRAVTIANLAKVGYPTPTGLYLRPVTDHATSVIPFKSAARAAIAASGYTILA